ncbi:NUDIX domain-containing protein [Plantactinospora sp. WMMC1484]|uniref:NUDIX domain-containing protein n=1 Tax=Plantactinospora sp. WMMC1484 TaxID=3404122 RepID=UPI003BF5C3B5
MTGPETPPMAAPRIAAGALFFDDEGRVLLVKPHYKNHWDIPGGYVEPGESPRAACIREIREELGLTIAVGLMLVIDWAPASGEGDKILFIFDAGPLSNGERESITLSDGELTEWRFISVNVLHDYMPARLSRRVSTAVVARNAGRSVYAEHGIDPLL